MTISQKWRRFAAAALAGVFCATSAQAAVHRDAESGISVCGRMVFPGAFHLSVEASLRGQPRIQFNGSGDSGQLLVRITAHEASPASACTVIHSGSAADIERRLARARRMAAGINAANIPYELLGRNSNAAARALVESMGLRVPMRWNLSNAPGLLAPLFARSNSKLAI